MRKFVKKISAALIAGLMAVMMCVPAFAAEVETQELPCDTPVHVNAMLYRTGTTTPSMGNGAFVRGATLTYNCDEDTTKVVLDVSPVTAGMPGSGVEATGHLTELEISGVAFESEVLSDDSTLFTGYIPGRVILGQRYVAAVGIDVPGAHVMPMSGEIVFS